MSKAKPANPNMKPQASKPAPKPAMKPGKGKC